MSGDIGTGTTTACIRLAKEVLDSRGTNRMLGIGFIQNLFVGVLGGGGGGLGQDG